MALNAINWFEIPATDMERATTFYTAMYGTPLESFVMETDNGKMPMLILPCDEQGLGGCVTYDPTVQPSTHGTRVYLNANPDLQPYLDRAVSAGATILLPKTHINENSGYYAVILDSEGNAVGLHSKA
jgi:uncharacterized protein